MHRTAVVSWSSVNFHSALHIDDAAFQEISLSQGPKVHNHCLRESGTKFLKAIRPYNVDVVGLRMIRENGIGYNLVSSSQPTFDC